MRIHRLPDGVYSTDIRFLFGTRDELNRYFRKHCGASEDQIGERTTGNFTYWEPKNPKHYNQRIISIVSDRTSTIPERRSIIVHESVHLALHLFDNKGIRYSSGNDEPLAYFIDYLTREGEAVL